MNIKKTNTPDLLKYGGIAFLTIALTLLHYITPYEVPIMHAIYRFLYYLPIIFAAFFWGKKGGLAVALIISILYLPHIFLSWGQIALHSTIAAFEILLYFVTGLLTGAIVDRWKAEALEKERILAAFRATEQRSTLGEMGHVIIHELKTPLASIEGAIHIICDEIRIPPELNEFKNILDKETKRIHKMLDQTLARLESGTVQKRRVAIPFFLDEIRELCQFFKSQPGVRFSIVNQSKKEFISADPDLLKQALVNLIKNAFEAIARNGSVTLFVRDNKKNVSFVTEDNGPGIASDRVKMIFKPFYNYGEDGMGLGLSITRRIADLHSGTLRYENVYPNGARFTLSIPEEESA